MKTIALRLVAMVALAGQLQWLPASVLCEREHRSPASHCDQNTTSPPAAVVGAEQSAEAPCALLGPCAVTAPVALAAASLRPFSDGVTHGDALGADLSPYSLDRAPLPPPPLA
jgi:hypothetical protein